MAEELRWETLLSTSVTTTNAVGEFRNETSGDISLRSIDLFCVAALDTPSDADQVSQYQLSKSRVVDTTNNTSIWQLNAGVSTIHDDTAGVGSGGGSMSVNKLYAKGQLTLEPGESVFLHLAFTNNPTTSSVKATLGYHFD